MVLLTAVRMRLNADTGNIDYLDAEDDVVFYTETEENLGATLLDAPSEVSALSLHFLRYHLLKNGVSSTSLVGLLKTHDFGGFVKMITEMHLQAVGSVDPEEALRLTFKVMSKLISMLEQRESALQRREQSREAADSESISEGE